MPKVSDEVDRRCRENFDTRHEAGVHSDGNVIVFRRDFDLLDRSLHRFLVCQVSACHG